MSRFFLALALIVALFSSRAAAESIVSDSAGNGINLPTTGGNVTNTITVLNAAVTTSPYTFYVYLNNGDLNSHNNPLSPTERESFYIPTRYFSNATLISQTFQPFNGSLVQCADCMRSAASPNTATGTYAFTFYIPATGYFTGNITYLNVGSNPLTVEEIISIRIYNPFPSADPPPVLVGGIVGDPQFVGLRGQSYQVHGVDGAVYNLVSERDVQVNSRFVFLTEGECPLVAATGKKDVNCWAHPGSYLGEMSFQQVVDGVVHAALVEAGSAKDGFALVEVDGQPLTVGDSVEYGSFTLHLTSTHSLTVHTPHFTFELRNSDRFINQELRARVPLQQLKGVHGLIGQTHSGRVWAGSLIKHIQGRVDDYVIADGDIFGSQFLYNRFHTTEQ